MTTKSSNEVTNIFARSLAKRGAFIWFVRLPAKVIYSFVFCHKSNYDNKTVNCSCCIKLGALNKS